MQLSDTDLQELCAHAEIAADMAARRIDATPYNSLAIDRKSGMSSEASEVVSQLDRDVQDLIIALLAPSISRFQLGLLAEESEDCRDRFERDYFWAIDPLDGTLPFLNGKPGYATSIALVSRQGIPHLGVVANPRNGDRFRAVRGMGADLNGESFQVQSRGKALTVFTDPSMLNNEFFLRNIPHLEALAGSSGLAGLEIREPAGAVLNVCTLLQTAPAIYVKAPKPVRGGGSIWDYAASSCIAHEAGGVATDIHGDPLDLNRSDSTFMNHRGFLFATSPSLHAQVRQQIDL